MHLRLGQGRTDVGEATTAVAQNMIYLASPPVGTEIARAAGGYGAAVSEHTPEMRAAMLGGFTVSLRPTHSTSAISAKALIRGAGG
jgi:hypothetical protein